MASSGRCLRCQNINCRCPPGLIFKPENGRCECPITPSAYTRNKICIPCNSPNMTGSIGATSTECACKSTLVWKDNMCQCPQRDSIIFNDACMSCSTRTSANFSGRGAVSSTQCSCKDQYTWLPDSGKCVCGVNSMYLNGACYLCRQYSNTVVSTGSELSACVCINNLVFDTRTFTCRCSGANDIIR